MLRYRDATEDDLPLIVEVYNTTIPGRMVTADTEPVTVQDRLAWFRQHDPLKRPLWMIYDGNDYLGWASYQSFYGRPAYDATAEISIYLAPVSRGKGIGRQVLQYAMESCDRLRINTLLGFIFAHNTPSISLFRSMGFDTWGIFPRIAVLDGVERDLVIVGKRINQ